MPRSQMRDVPKPGGFSYTTLRTRVELITYCLTMSSSAAVLSCLMAWVLAVVCLTAGCGDDGSGLQPVEPAASRRSVPVRVLVIDDARLAAALERQWNARAEGEIDFRQGSSSEIAALERPRLGADVVIFPSSLIGELASRELLSPLERDQLSDPEVDWEGLFPLQRTGEVSWGEQIYGIPFGSPTLTLYYRTDLFEEQGIEPPTTWVEYATLAERLSDRGLVPNRVADAAWHGTSEPLGAGWGAKMLLARAASYARHRNQFSTLFDGRTMEPLIAGPPFVRALTEMVATAQYGPTDAGPADARSLFASGGCAMAVSWPTRADASLGEARVPTGFAELPGSSDVFNFRTAAWETRGEDESERTSLLGIAGRIGSVTRECRRRSAAINTLFFFGGLTDEIGPESAATTVHRDRHLESASRWVNQELDADAARQYATAARSSQSQTSWLHCVRIPGKDRYLTALDLAVRQALDGLSSPQAALEVAASEWRQVTESLGVELQRQAYARSIGREP